jgi:2-dehydropantoate 2-reductase
VAGDLGKAARAEARACFAAADIEVADETDAAERRRVRGITQPVGGTSREGGSSWQSLRRGTGNIEADWLNGEIVLLGRLHGVPTPVNERLQTVANRMAHQGMAPGSISAGELASGIL